MRVTSQVHHLPGPSDDHTMGFVTIEAEAAHMYMMYMRSVAWRLRSFLLALEDLLDP